jgi:hypothetical protein
MVTSANYGSLRPLNFGRRTLQMPITAESIAAEIARYDAADATAVSGHVRATEALDAAFLGLVAIYEDVIEQWRTTAGVDCCTERRAAAGFLEAIAPFTNTFYATEHLRAADRRIQMLETKVASLSNEIRMLPLTGEHQKQVRITGLKIPTRATAGTRFTAAVAIENGSPRLLASTAPFPVCICYHWLTGDGSAVVCHDGLRSELLPFLLPGDLYEYMAEVAAPEAAGRYRLRITLVQEQVAWFEAAGTGQFRDAEIEISDPSGPDRS